MKAEELNDLVREEDLEGDLKEVAELIGIENALKLVEVYGGSRLYIPVADSVVIPAGHRRVSDMYYKNNKGLDDIRRETGYAESTIRTILFKNGDTRQQPLFDKLPAS